MIVESPFRPHWLLRSPHLQTLWPVWTRRTLPAGRKERLELPDGDFLDLFWCDGGGPLVIVMHGLEGSINSHYAAAIMQALQHNGFTGLFMHFRGCSGVPNRLARAYHSGETGDFMRVLEYATSTIGKPLHAAIGYSLGGNVLLKWLGEQGGVLTGTPPDAAAITFLKYDLDINSTALTERLRTEKSVLIVPGDQFGIDHHFRIGYGYTNPPLAPGLERVSRLIDQLAAVRTGCSGLRP